MAFLVRYVYGGDRRPPGEREVERALQLAGPLTTRQARSGTERSHYYHNPDTRVHCRFVSYQTREPGEVGLDFEMLQPCPSFFALESLPLAVSVARELRLQVQVLEPGPPTRPFVPTVEGLLKLWRDGNRQAVDELVKQRQAPAYCTAEALENSWEYMTLYPELRRRYGRNGMQVPPIRLLQKKSTGEVYRCVTWKALSPVVMPEVDLVELLDPPSPLQEGRIYDVHELVEASRPHIREVSQPIFHYLFDKDRPPVDMVEAIVGLEARTMRSFEEIDYDQVTDVPVPADEPLPLPPPEPRKAVKTRKKGG